jgi:2-polyprenyl-3-methyl-5-hydroxy-6-metoxy-1,4-benzoquinol methylase
MFDARVASRELRRFRRKGPRRTTHDLCEGICLHCADASTVLDIGPGIGALTFELLEVGVQHATDVDASSAFLDAAREEAARRLTGNDFEVFVHPASRMEEIVRRAGFALARRRGRWVWGADIYIRNRMAPKS